MAIKADMSIMRERFKGKTKDQLLSEIATLEMAVNHLCNMKADATIAWMLERGDAFMNRGAFVETVAIDGVAVQHMDSVYDEYPDQNAEGFDSVESMLDRFNESDSGAMIVSFNVTAILGFE